MANEKRDEKKREMNIERRRTYRNRKGRTKNRNKPQTNRARVQKTNNDLKSKKGETYSEKASSIKSEISSLIFRTRNLPETVNQLDNSINEIASRIQNIRDNNYHAQKKIENEYSSLLEAWSRLSPNIQSYALEQSNKLVQNQNNLQARVNRATSTNDILRYETFLSEIKNDLINVENVLRSQLDDFQSKYHMINNNLRTAENTVTNLRNSSIGWKNNEHPVLAVQIQDLTHDKKGILTLTNFRIIFEEVREEVIRKTLFIATEKKTVHEILLDQPIGSIDLIEKGRVGLFKGAGLFIRFKPQTGLDELKIDTDGNEDDTILHFYNYIISGEVDKETESLEEQVDDYVPLVCPTCSAPYGEEILKGQTSVKCIYCGAVIKI